MAKNEEKYDKIKKELNFDTNAWVNTGNSWLIDNGVISDFTHNAILINLYVNFPKVRYVEYFMSVEEKTIEVHLFFSWYNYFFQREGLLVDNAKELLNQYLKDYKVTVKKKRYGKR